VHRTTYSFGQQGDFPNVKVEDVNGNQPANDVWPSSNGRHDHPVVQSWSSLPAEHSVDPTAGSYHGEDVVLADVIAPTGRARASNGYASRKTAELLSDSDDDEEFMRTHSAHLVKYMIQVHKRRQRVVEEYEKKREVSLNCIQEQLARIYQKRFGSRNSMKSLSADDVMNIPIDLLLRSTRGASDIVKKRRTRYEDSIMNRYLDDVEANDGSWLGMDVLANGGQPPQVCSISCFLS
jgi:hypothetical protein